MISESPDVIGQRQIRLPRRPWRASIIMNRYQNGRASVQVHGFCRTALTHTSPRQVFTERRCGGIAR